MEENLNLNNSIIYDTNEEIKKEFIQEKLPNNQYHKRKNNFKEKTCNVIAYNKSENTLDVKFDNFGIRIKNVKDFNGNTVSVKYKGEIGKPNFEYKL